MDPHMFLLASSLVTHCNAQFALSPSPLPEKHHVHAGAIYNDVLHVFSGWSGSSPYRNYEWRVSVKPYTGDWPNYPDYFTNPLGVDRVRVGGNSVQISNLVYIINPWIEAGTGTPWNEMFIFDLLSNSYSVSTPPSISGYGGCALYDPNPHYIYYIGGMEYDGAEWKYPLDKQDYDPVQVYDITADSWSQKTSLSPATNINDCEFHPNMQYIYRFGGEDTNGNKLDRISRYTISTDEWNTVSTAVLTAARNQHRCDLLRRDNYIYCMGGKVDGDVRTGLVDIFDPITETIVGTDNMAYRRTGYHTSKYGDNCIYITGGKGNLASSSYSDYYLNVIETLGDCDSTVSPTTDYPTKGPSKNPSENPTKHPTEVPSQNPIEDPSMGPTVNPTVNPTKYPTHNPTGNPTKSPTQIPTKNPIDYSMITTNDGTKNATKSVLKIDSTLPTEDVITTSSTTDSTKDTIFQNTTELFMHPSTTRRRALVEYTIYISLEFLYPLDLNDTLIVLNTLHHTTQTILNKSDIADDCSISDSLMNHVQYANNSSIYNIEMLKCESETEPHAPTVQSFSNQVISDLIQNLNQHTTITIIHVTVDVQMDVDTNTNTDGTNVDTDRDATDEAITNTEDTADSVSAPNTLFGIKTIYIFVTIPIVIVILTVGVYLGIRGTIAYEEKKLKETAAPPSTAPKRTMTFESGIEKPLPMDSEPGARKHRPSNTESMDSMDNVGASLPGTLSSMYGDVGGTPGAMHETAGSTSMGVQMTSLMEDSAMKFGFQAEKGTITKDTSAGTDEEEQFFGECEGCRNCRPGRINEGDGSFYCLQCWALFETTRN